MHRAVVLTWIACLAASAATAQSITAEVLSGKLINPEVGAYAWYDLKDFSVEHKFRLRQAIVGKERVRFKTGYWLETQIIPEVGFPAVYKMLLTGPASDPGNVHRVILQEGQRPLVEIEVQDAPKGPDQKTERKSLGVEDIPLIEGSITAEHFELVGSAGADGKSTEVWINEAVRPMGIVRLKSPQGELNLIRYGVGGPDGQSVLGLGGPQEDQSTQDATQDSAENPGQMQGGKVTVKVSTDTPEEPTSGRKNVQEELNQRRRR